MSFKNSNLSLYNSKYLKYKNKYLSLKKIFGGGDLNLIIVLKSGERIISISKEEELVPAIARELGLKTSQIQVSYNNNVVTSGLTAEDCGINNNSRVTVDNMVYFITTYEDFSPVVNEIFKLNYNSSGLTFEELMNCVTFNNNNIVHINFEDKRINRLPESFGNIKITGDLNLSNNIFQTLPESFGNIIVGGNLYLTDNYYLETLPESFRNITVNGDLNLAGNHLKTLPESFGNIIVGGDLILNDNLLRTLPESFGNITVGGNLHLCFNQLKILPKSFRNITVGGNLYINLFNSDVIITKPNKVSGRLYQT